MSSFFSSVSLSLSRSAFLSLFLYLSVCITLQICEAMHSEWISRAEASDSPLWNRQTGRQSTSQWREGGGEWGRKWMKANGKREVVRHGSKWVEMKGENGGRYARKWGEDWERGERTSNAKEERGGKGAINSGGGKREKRVMRLGGWGQQRNAVEALENVRSTREYGGGRREGEKGVDEKEVISGLFLPAFCQPPSEIFRGETHTTGVFLNCQRTQCKTGAHV